MLSELVHAEHTHTHLDVSVATATSSTANEMPAKIRSNPSSHPKSYPEGILRREAQASEIQASISGLARNVLSFLEATLKAVSSTQSAWQSCRHASA